MTELALLSYNLRRDTRSDGPNRWRHRRDRVATTLRKADIAGLQEARWPMLRDLTFGAPRHRWVGRRAGRRSAGGRVRPGALAGGPFRPRRPGPLLAVLPTRGPRQQGPRAGRRADGDLGPPRRAELRATAVRPEHPPRPPGGGRPGRRCHPGPGGPGRPGRRRARRGHRGPQRPAGGRGLRRSSPVPATGWPSATPTSRPPIATRPTRPTRASRLPGPACGSTSSCSPPTGQ